MKTNATQNIIPQMELPLVPVISKDFRGGESEYSLGKVTGCEVGEYLKSTDTFGNEILFIRNFDDAEDVLSAVFSWDFYLGLDAEEAEQKYNNLPWNRGILMYID